MLTLVEAAKLRSGEVVRSTIIEQFARSSDILMSLPMVDIQGNAYKYSREETLPGVAFRGVNEAYPEDTGVINPLIEPLVIAGGDLDVDKFIIDTQGEDQRSTREMMKVKALAHRITLSFLKGDSTSDPRQFDGLQVRLTGSQVISAGSTGGGAALSLTKLDELIDSVDNPTHLIMNKTVRRLLTAASRDTAVGGHVNFDQDSFGRRITTYNDLPILIADQDNAGNDILPFNEAAVSGNDTASSVYCASFGEDTLHGIQTEDIDARDLGELEEKPVFRTRVEWYVGLVVLAARGAARLRHIGNLAVVK